MAHNQLEKRYKQWCREASRGNIQHEQLDDDVVAICPLDRNVSTTALVLRNEHDRVLPMPPLTSILRETARRIDANAKSLTKPSTPTNTELVAVDLKTLTTCLANLCSYEDETKGRHGLGLHLLPFTIGNWIAEIRVQDGTKGRKTTEEKLMGIFQQFSVSERFRYVAVHQSYTGLSRMDAQRKKFAQSMLQFKEKNDPIMNVLGEGLDAIDVARTSDPNILGLYLCRKSMIQWLEGSVHKALKNFGVFSPKTPLGHILATRLYEASRVYGDKNLHPIQRFAGRSDGGSIIREIPKLVRQAQALVRQNHGMIQVTQLLERLTRVLLQVDGQRDGSKERGMLYNLKHATALRPSNCLVFFLNTTLAGERDEQQIFAPPVLSDFDLQEDSSGESKPSWAKSLAELERLTGHDTSDDMKGSTTVTMAGFPFQCTFVLAHKEGERFYYCPHRFCDQQDATDHVKTVHQGHGLPSDTYAKIAQLDSMLEETAFGKRMRPVNEFELLRKLRLDEKDPEKLRLRPTLHDDLLKMSEALTQNTRLLGRLEKDRDEAIQHMESLNRLAENNETKVEKLRKRQLFNALNREITEVMKFIISPAVLMKFQDAWHRARTRKEYITNNMYKEFVTSNDQLSWLDRTVGEGARKYKEQVKQLGGIDPGATPAGVPGGGIRAGKSNIIGMLTQNLIERSRLAESIQDANEALVATNRIASFQRVVSKHDQDFGASNVIPAATPLIAAKGWDDDDENRDGDSEMVEDMEDIKKEENDPKETGHGPSGPQKVEKAKEEATTATVTTTYVSNPLKRPRSKKQGVTSERAVVLRAGDASMLEKKRLIEPIVPKCLESIFKIELKRIFKVCQLDKSEIMGAQDACKRILNLAFDPRLREEVTKMKMNDALKPGQIRTLRDPFRERVSVLVLTDPRVIMYPTGVLMPILTSCISLIDRMHEKIKTGDKLLCLLLATGLCHLLQPRFRLSKAGLQIVCDALKIVLMENIEKGRNGHWKVVSSLVATLNANLAGFWNAALLRRYHKIEDPSYTTKHVDTAPEKTYAPLDQLPTVEMVAARIRKPRICETSAISVLPEDSNSQFSRLRVEETKALIEQVSLAVLNRDTTLVRIKDSDEMDSKDWVRRLLEGNANAVIDPHRMCTWFRERKVTFAEYKDEEKHQWLRLARCCICTELLGTIPSEGWCCLSGVTSLDTLADQALRDVTDPIERETRREQLRQEIVNKIFSQPNYPSFHFWHQHCKQMQDERRFIRAHAKAKKKNQKMEVPNFDECPLCCTKYPRDKKLFPSMESISKCIASMEQSIGGLVPIDSAPQSPRPMLTDISQSQQTVESKDPTLEDYREGQDSIEDNRENIPRAVDVTRTGVAYLGALFQAESGCEASPVAMIAPSPVMPDPEHELSLYDTMMHASDYAYHTTEEVERVLEETPTIGVAMASVAPNPVDIGNVNEILSEIFQGADVNFTEDQGSQFDFEQFFSQLSNVSNSALAQNIEGIDSGVGEGHATLDQARPLEPSAAIVDESLLTTSTSNMAVVGSWPCLREKCIACSFMSPGTSQIGVYRLTAKINCLSHDVIYVSMCPVCAKVNGLGHSIGSMLSEVVQLQAQSRERTTLLSKCSLNHDTVLIGLEQYTTDDDLMEKGAMWKSRLEALSLGEPSVI